MARGPYEVPPWRNMPVRCVYSRCKHRYTTITYISYPQHLIHLRFPLHWIIHAWYLVYKGGANTATKLSPPRRWRGWRRGSRNFTLTDSGSTRPAGGSFPMAQTTSRFAKRAAFFFNVACGGVFVCFFAKQNVVLSFCPSAGGKQIMKQD